MLSLYFRLTSFSHRNNKYSLFLNDPRMFVFVTGFRDQKSDNSFIGKCASLILY